MNQFNKRVRTNTGNIFNINYSDTIVDTNDNSGGGGGGGGSVEVINNLTTDNPTAALSAAQGVVLKGITDQLIESIETLDSAITDLSEEVQYTSGLVTTLNATVAAQGGLIAGLTTTVTSHGNRITELETLTGDLSFRMVNVESTTENLGIALSSISSSVNLLETRVDQSVTTTSTPVFSNAIIGSANINTSITILNSLAALVNQNVTIGASPRFGNLNLGLDQYQGPERIIQAYRNIGNNSNLFITYGRADSAGNSLELGFRLVSIGSTSNRIMMGFHSKEIISLLYGGNVGINTTSPAYILDVDGKMRSRVGYILPNVTTTPEEGMLTWNGTSKLPRIYNGTAWIDLNPNANNLAARVQTLETYLGNTRIYGRIRLSVGRGSSGNPVLNSYSWTSSFTTLGCSLANGSTINDEIYFTKDGTFEWPVNMGLIVQILSSTLSSTTRQVVGIAYVPENNQTFRIRPYFPGTLTTDIWPTAFPFDTSVIYEAILVRQNY